MIAKTFFTENFSAKSLQPTMFTAGGLVRCVRFERLVTVSLLRKHR